MDKSPPSSTVASTPAVTVPQRSATDQKLKLDILNIVHTSQIQHGLRQEDYQRYRQYLTKRLVKVKQSLKGAIGKKQYVQKLTDSNLITDVRYLQIVLIKIERAWAYAMDLKKEYEQGDKPRLKYHINGRLKKANKYADLFEKFCKDTCDNYTIVEAMAYTSFIKATHFMNTKNWYVAKDQITLSRSIFELLVEHGDQSLKSLYEKKVEDTDPVIRYCQYNIRGQENTSEPLDIPKTIAYLSNLLKKKTDTNTDKDDTLSIKWRSKQINVADKVKDKFNAFYQLEKDFNSATEFTAKFQFYDKMISQLILIEKIIKNDLVNISRVNLKNKTIKSEVEEANLKTILSYVVYHKMKYLYERNEHIANVYQKIVSGTQETKDLSILRKKKASTKDLVRVYGDNIKIFISMVENRSDISATAASLNQAKDNDCQLLYLKSKRLHYISMYFLEEKKFSETTAIMSRIQGNVAYIKKSTKNQDLLKNATELEEAVNKVKSQIHANSFIEQITKNEELKNQMSNLSIATEKSNDLLSGIDNYDSSFLTENKLVDLTPQLQPVAAKPLFFDLAFNSCEFPSLEARKKASNTTPSKGIFGFFGR